MSDPHAERIAAEADALLYGTGFMLDGVRIDPSRMKIIAAPSQKVDIVPSHCTGTALSFDPGVLQVNKDGSGYIAIDERHFSLEDDRCEGPDGPEGSVHWITRLDASEIVALRDFLTGATPALPYTGALKPVSEVEMVSHDGGYEQPAPSVWRVEIDGYCADFETEAGANNFRSAIQRFALQQPDTGDVAALREALEEIKGLGASGGGSGGGYRAVCIATETLAALSKPNAPRAPT